ncbi:hypothetical protein ACH79_43450 [Bradyrhizobium sp. CCBAU 051011]|nr:hypothetical protein ACH79_43450 [Bradyrhizobium sp. CCBAU 051011]
MSPIESTRVGDKAIVRGWGLAKRMAEIENVPIERSNGFGDLRCPRANCGSENCVIFQDQDRFQLVGFRPANDIEMTKEIPINASRRKPIGILRLWCVRNVSALNREAESSQFFAERFVSVAAFSQVNYLNATKGLKDRFSHDQALPPTVR